MRLLGIAALAAAGLGFFLGTERGRRLSGSAKSAAQERFRAWNEQHSRKETEKAVEQALEQPHPDTAIARAFEEAVA